MIIGEKKIALSRQALGDHLPIVSLLILLHNRKQIKQASKTMKTISLSGKRGTGFHAIVSDEDYLFLAASRWLLNKGGYAYQAIGSMHRIIMQPDQALVVDHINGNRLDNRRENLRICTSAENARNHRLSRNNTTGYKGLVRMRSGLWKARLVHNGRQIDLGFYIYRTDAARAYNTAAVKYFGEFANLNTVGEVDY